MKHTFLYYFKEYDCMQIIAGILAISGTIAGAICANLLNKRSEQRNEANFEKSIIKSLESELKTIYNLYGDSFINDLENLNDGEMFLWQYTARQDFFTIFHSNGIFIGKIKDEELRNSIIKTYITLKKFLEGLLNYTEDFKRLDFEKDQLLKTLNNLATFYINSQQLEHILSPNLSVKAALVNLRVACTEDNIVFSLEKQKNYIIELQLGLIRETKQLKKEFADVKLELLNCFGLIEKYLTK